MNQFKKSFLVLTLTLAVMIISRVTVAQDGVKMNPDNHKVLVDDDNVRVYEVTFAPGQKMGMHSHPRHVVYALTDGTITLTSNGKSEAVTLKAGDAVDMDAVSHSTENSGTSEVRLVVVEIKNDTGMSKSKVKDKRTDRKM